MKRRGSTALDALRLAGTLALVSGCAAAGANADRAAAPSPYAVEGAYGARLTVGEQAFDGALSLRTTADARVSGSLRIVSPVRIDGPVRGRVIDELLRITITYAGVDGCDSRIEGILTIERGGDAVEGPVTVNDCGQDIAGRLRITR